MDLGFFLFIIYVVVIISFVIFPNWRRGYNNRISNYEWYPKRRNRRQIAKQEREENRRIALEKVQPFLQSHNDIMGNLCISNSNCKVDIAVEKNGEKKIICLSKILNSKNKKMFLTAKATEEFSQYYFEPYDYVIDSAWNSICLNFSDTTKYENIFSALSVAMLDISEIEIGASGVNKIVKKQNLLDINSATEKELLSLPGINVVTAKKIIKYVEKNNGFKTFEEFFQKIKIKENFVEQIKAVTCINPKIAEKEIIDNLKEDISSTENKEELNISETPLSIHHSENERIIDI